VMLNCREAVGNGTDSHTLDIVSVVASPTAVVVLPFLHAIINQDRQKRHRHVGRIQLFDYVISPQLNVDEVPKLAFERVLKLSEGRE
jgi:hypothetical protein